MRCTVHAENASIMARRETKMKGGRAATMREPTSPHARRSAPSRRSAARPAFAEWTGARLHIAHKSSADGLDLVRRAKSRGVDVTVETCPQYLIFSVDDMDALGGQLRVNPPIREKGHAEALWAALHDGTIDMIATDHAPHLPEEKASNRHLGVRMRLPRSRDPDADHADPGGGRPAHPQPVCRVVGGGAGARLGLLSAQGAYRARFGRRHRHRRPRGRGQDIAQRASTPAAT